MPFPHKGENHHNGILNEKQITQFLDEESLIIGPSIKQKYVDTYEKLCFVHQGGTKCVDDANILDEKGHNKVGGISFKNHKSGTFDWINTTKNIPYEEDLKTRLQNFKTLSNINQETDFKEKEKILRSERDKIFEIHIKNFTSEMIKSLLEKIYEEYSDHIVITLCDKKKYL